MLDCLLVEEYTVPDRTRKKKSLVTYIMVNQDNYSVTIEESSEIRIDGVEVDEDGRPKRTGNLWTASAHIITAVIGSGVLSLAWCLAQLGWIIGPTVIIIFALITYFSSCMLADCYRNIDTGKRHYSYSQAVNAYLGKKSQMMCGIIQYVNITGTAIGYIITAAIGAVTIHKQTCLHSNGGHEELCTASNYPFMLSFGAIQIILSQIPNIHKLSWLSSIAAIMSFSYAGIGVALSFLRVIHGNIGETSLRGIPVGPEFSALQKLSKSFSAIGDIAFSYSFALIMIEIQDTVRAPKENKQMKKANLLSVLTTTIFYMGCGCFGYAAFGHGAPGNLLAGFGANEPKWLVTFANVCIVIHIMGGYQVYCQPLFGALENKVAEKYPDSKFITKEYPIRIMKLKYSFNMFRFVWRTLFVITTTSVAIAVPFFNEILALLGALTYWPLSILFPIQMYIAQKKMKVFSIKWTLLQLIICSCGIVALGAVIGSVQGVIKALI